MAMLFWLLVLLAMAWGLADWQLSNRDDLNSKIIVRPVKPKPKPAPVAAPAEVAPDAAATPGTDASNAVTLTPDEVPAAAPVDEKNAADHPAS